MQSSDDYNGTSLSGFSELHYESSTTFLGFRQKKEEADIVPQGGEELAKNMGGKRYSPNALYQAAAKLASDYGLQLLELRSVLNASWEQKTDHLNNHPLYVGELKLNSQEINPDSEQPKSVYTVITPPATDVPYDVEGPGAGDFIGAGGLTIEQAILLGLQALAQQDEFKKTGMISIKIAQGGPWIQDATLLAGIDRAKDLTQICAQGVAGVLPTFLQEKVERVRESLIAGIDCLAGGVQALSPKKHHWTHLRIEVREKNDVLSYHATHTDSQNMSLDTYSLEPIKTALRKALGEGANLIWEEKYTGQQSWTNHTDCGRFAIACEFGMPISSEQERKNTFRRIDQAYMDYEPPKESPLERAESPIHPKI